LRKLPVMLEAGGLGAEQGARCGEAVNHLIGESKQGPSLATRSHPRRTRAHPHARPPAQRLGRSPQRGYRQHSSSLARAAVPLASTASSSHQLAGQARANGAEQGLERARTAPARPWPCPEVSPDQAPSKAISCAEGSLVRHHCQRLRATLHGVSRFEEDRRPKSSLRLEPIAPTPHGKPRLGGESLRKITCQLQGRRRWPRRCWVSAMAVQGDHHC